MLHQNASPSRHNAATPSFSYLCNLLTMEYSTTNTTIWIFTLKYQHPQASKFVCQISTPLEPPLLPPIVSVGFKIALALLMETSVILTTISRN